MNNKELNLIKKNLKEESDFVMGTICSCLINKETLSVKYLRKKHFDSLELDEKELFYKNFKKTLSGKNNVKIFELEFDTDSETRQSLEVLRQNPSQEEFDEKVEEFISKIISNYKYETDILFNICSFTFEEENSAYQFLIGNICKPANSKKEFLFDSNSNDFNINFQLDTVLNLQSPVDGFMYPVYEDFCVNVNKVLYYSSKSNEQSDFFVEDFLNCKKVLSNLDEKIKFSNLVSSLTGNTYSVEQYKKICSEIDYFFEEESVEKIRKQDLKSIFENLNIDVSTFEENFDQIFESSNAEVSIQNIKPDKSLVLKDNNFSIKINSENIENLTQVKDSSNNVYLLVKCDDLIKMDDIFISNEEIKIINI